MSYLKKIAMGIVNQILDAANISVDQRQKINDRCDDMVEGILLEERLKAASLGWDESRISFAKEIGDDSEDDDETSHYYKNKSEFLRSLNK